MHWNPGTRVTDDCEPQCGCWVSNPDPLQRAHSVLNPRTISLAPFFIILMIAENSEISSGSHK